MKDLKKNHVYFGYLLLVCLIVTVLLSELAQAQAPKRQDVLVKMAPHATMHTVFGQSSKQKVQSIGGGWVRAQVPQNPETLEALENHPDVEYVQPNYELKLQHTIRFENADAQRVAALEALAEKPASKMKSIRPDNPDFPGTSMVQNSGKDPMINKQWGMINSGADQVWNQHKGRPEMIVAVLDSGVDYTHEDLVPNLWRNKDEIPNNGIDDDRNGYIDDIIGWDFAKNDNKPYDLATDSSMDLLRGGNPGHGTHCAGNIAARGGNAIGISGVAPNVKIMSLRFIGEEGAGTTAAAVAAIRYAVDNGAKILSNSWGGEGQDDASEENLALKEAIQYAESKGVLFIAAAGNGRKGKGYDNDSDKKPIYPASYTLDNIITVAALDSSDRLGKFSNFGARTVHIGAPGVKVFSTMVADRYSDTVINLFGMKAYWDGTSMATPHVAGAAALYWSANPNASYKDVKNAILKSARRVSGLAGKVATEGKLDIKELMK